MKVCFKREVKKTIYTSIGCFLIKTWQTVQNSHLRASSYRNDAGEKVSDHRFHRNGEAIHMNGVDETQAVLKSKETQD